MRLSNIFIYGSVSIIVAASLGFLIYQSWPVGEKEPANELVLRIKALEKENSDLLEQSGKTVRELSDRVTQLNDDLQRSSRLVTDKDEEISRLKSQNVEGTLAASLSVALGCQPQEVGPAVQQLLSSYRTLQQRYQLVNQQLSLQMSDPGKRGETAARTTREPDEPRIRKLELSAPANQWAQSNGEVNTTPQAVSPDQTNRIADDRVVPAAGVEAETGRNTVDLQNGRGELVENLSSQIESLKADLRNREKLLFEQTSLIEELKKKTRIETGFRSGNNGTVIESSGPFRDLGTFPIQSSQ